MASKTLKAADKAQACRKLVTSLQKLYEKPVLKLDMPVLETMLFAACLEDNTWQDAEAGYQKLYSEFFDLNDVRVSSVAELEEALQPLRFADWKGLRIKSILRHVFETTYAFEFEKLRRLNADSAVRALKKIDDITPFICDFTLYHALGNHVVYLDTTMQAAAVWLGLVPPSSSVADATDALKSAVRKQDVFEFCETLRLVATDPKHIDRLSEIPEEELSMLDATDRLVALQSPPKRKKKNPPVADSATTAPGKTNPNRGGVATATVGKTASAADSKSRPVAKKK
jgi:endonuclease III